MALVLALACAFAFAPPSLVEAAGTNPEPFKAKLVDNAQLAARLAATLSSMAHKPAPRGLSAEQRKGWDEQTRWLGDASARFAAMKKSMDAVLAKTKVSPSEMVQTNLQFAQQRDATETESHKYETVAPACRERAAAAIAALKGS
ncbi:MAG TPA: hypothetical protein VIF62_09810 [Labilithrix sp.]